MPLRVLARSSSITVASALLPSPWARRSRMHTIEIPVETTEHPSSFDAIAIESGKSEKHSCQ